MASTDILSRSRIGSNATYQVRFANQNADVAAAQRLRFEVFNLELNEGLDSAYLSGLDQDRFDEVCDHLIVEEAGTGQIVGTYRLQTGVLADANFGFYSEQEFDFSPFAAIRCEMVELGRACVHRDHRKMSVLNLLWRSIMQYALDRGAHYLVGCSSLTSQDPALGHAMFQSLCGQHFVAPPFRTVPLAAYSLPAADCAGVPFAVPRLLRAYLSLGAKICGPPALDSEFKTIDFLTLLDLHSLPPAARNHFFES